MAVLAALALTACGETATTESNPAGNESVVTDSSTDSGSDSVTAEGVLLAAVLLSTADIEAAVAEGLVTPDEVDEAQRAIDEGTLNKWRERAETTERD